MDVVIVVYLTLLTVWWIYKTGRIYAELSGKYNTIGGRFMLCLIGGAVSFVYVAIIGAVVGLFFAVLYHGWVWILWG